LFDDSSCIKTNYMRTGVVLRLGAVWDWGCIETGGCMGLGLYKGVVTRAAGKLVSAETTVPLTEHTPETPSKDVKQNTFANLL
jgi:hypothetical protein